MLVASDGDCLFVVRVSFLINVYSYFMSSSFICDLPALPIIIPILSLCMSIIAVVLSGFGVRFSLVVYFNFAVCRFLQFSCLLMLCQWCGTRLHRLLLI